MSTLSLSAGERPCRARLSLSPEAKGIGLGLLAATIWGAYLAVAKAGVGSGLEATDIAAIRFGVAGLIMLPWLALNAPVSAGGIGWPRALALSLLAGPLFVLVGVGGYSFAPLAHGAVMQPAALTIVATVLAGVLLGDRPTGSRIAGLGAMILGLAVIAGPGLLTGGSLAPLGDAMFVAAGTLWALFTLLARRWRVSPLAATAAVSIVSAIVYVPAYLMLTGAARLIAAPATMLGAQIIVQGVLAGVVATLAITRATQLLGAARAAVFPALVPAVAIVLGIPLTGEVPSGIQVVGLGIVSAGLLLALNVVRLGRSQGRAPAA